MLGSRRRKKRFFDGNFSLKKVSPSKLRIDYFEKKFTDSGDFLRKHNKRISATLVFHFLLIS
jgi:hypothetical protein